MVQQPAYPPFFLLCWFSTVKMEVTSSSETPVNIQTTRCYKPEDDNLHNYRCGNLRSYIENWTFLGIFLLLSSDEGGRHSTLLCPLEEDNLHHWSSGMWDPMQWASPSLASRWYRSSFRRVVISNFLILEDRGRPKSHLFCTLTHVKTLRIY
jgi:hypothetical protein